MFSAVLQHEQFTFLQHKGSIPICYHIGNVWTFSLWTLVSVDWCTTARTIYIPAAQRINTNTLP